MTTSPDIVSHKEKYRQQMRHARRDFVASLSSEHREKLERQQWKNLSSIIVERKYSQIAAYAPSFTEPGALSWLGLWRKAQTAHTHIYFPVSEYGGQMSWSELYHDSEFHTGMFGIPEIIDPHAVKLWDLPQCLDAVIVPALALGRDGTRLGQGGGYYDRFLAELQNHNCSPLLIGVVYDHEFVDTVPAEIHDIPVDVVVTPQQIVFL